MRVSPLLLMAVVTPLHARPVRTADIEKSVAVTASFELIAKGGKGDLLAAAIDVCRLQFGEASLDEMHPTAEWFDTYKGPGKDMLNLVCDGYLQAISDVLPSYIRTAKQAARIDGRGAR